MECILKECAKEVIELGKNNELKINTLCTYGKNWVY